MDWGGPEFVLAIIAMAMFAGVLKTAIRAKHGLPDFTGGRGKRAERQELARQRDESSGLVDGLRDENRRLSGRVEAMEDRLIVLEKIVTDGGYTLSHEIEALRDRRGARQAEREF
jgi:hypothetical protein